MEGENINVDECVKVNARKTLTHTHQSCINRHLLCSISDEFYSLFYLGLYCESIGETSKASYYMRAATRTEYAKGRGASDYMTSCARVHCQLRHWV